MGRRVVAGILCLVVAGAPQVALASDPWGGADLAVGISSLPRVAQPGQPLTYQVEVRNSGPGDAVLPVLTVRVPRGVKILSVNVAECQSGHGRHEIVCRSPRDVLANGTGGVTITGLVRPGARGPLKAWAGLSSEVVDTRQANNAAEAVTMVDEGADLAVRLVSSRRSALPGQWFTLRALVRNRGPQVVRDAHVFFQPRRARFMWASGARCHGRPGYVGCALPPIKSGARGLLQLMFRVPWQAAREVDASATVYSRRLGDRRPANNQARMRVALRRG